MSKGISNIQIEKALEKINDEDISSNFIGVFPSSYMSQFINHAAMISQKKRKYLFIIANTNSSEKNSTHWRNMTFSSSILLVLMA